MVRSLFYIWSLVLVLQLCTALHYQWDGVGEVCTVETEGEQKEPSKSEKESESENESKKEKDFLEDALLPVFTMPSVVDSLCYIPIATQSLIHFCAGCLSPPPEANN